MIKERVLVTIELDPESELAKALATPGQSVVLVSNGKRFVVNSTEDDLEGLRS